MKTVLFAFLFAMVIAMIVASPLSDNGASSVVAGKTPIGQGGPANSATSYTAVGTGVTALVAYMLA